MAGANEFVIPTDCKPVSDFAHSLWRAQIPTSRNIDKPATPPAPDR
jgi:hypothetical protein